MAVLMRLIFLLQLAATPVLAAGLMAGNSIDDIFTVKSIAGKSAVAEGKAGSLKAGDSVYFIRSPFKFSVSAVKGDQITVALPDGHNVEVGQTFMRNRTESVKKAMEKENRLKQALEE